MKNEHDIGSAPDIARHLQDAISQLQRDLNRVEVWAGALSGFVRPVPQYHPSTEFVLSPATGEDPEPPRRERMGRAGDPATK